MVASLVAFGDPSRITMIILDHLWSSSQGNLIFDDLRSLCFVCYVPVIEDPQVPMINLFSKPWEYKTTNHIITKVTKLPLIYSIYFATIEQHSRINHRKIHMNINQIIKTYHSKTIQQDQKLIKTYQNNSRGLSNLQLKLLLRDNRTLPN